MAFTPSDFKKTSRGSGDTRTIYPHQIRDDRHTAAIGFAVAYFERMVGQRRAAFEAEALLEFFGDPRLARGLVACLARTYSWRSLSFDEALGLEAAAALDRAGITRPAELRARLYALANQAYAGFIPLAERPAALAALAAGLARAEGESGSGGDQESGSGGDQARGKPGEGALFPERVRRATLPLSGASAVSDAPPLRNEHRERRELMLTATQLERALTLDAEGEQVLVRLGPPPAPAEVVELYNFHSLETALCYAERVRLRLHGQVWTMLRSAHNLARRYRVTYSVGDLPGSLFDNRLELTIFGRRDALGGWGRAGRRLARAILRLLAAHPGCAIEGEALTHVAGRGAALRLDGRALAVLGAGAVSEAPADAWEDEAVNELQRAWGRALVRGRTAGWRLRRDPEPLVSAEGVVVPDFALRRGNAGLPLCLAPGRAAAEAIVAGLSGTGRTATAVILAHASAAPALKGCKALVVTYAERPADAIPRLVTALERAWPRGLLLVRSDPWDDLAARVAAEGFVDEVTAASMLGCTPGEVAGQLRRRAYPGLFALAGLGVCDHDTLDEVRDTLTRSAEERAA